MAGASQARSAVFVLLALLGTTGCAVVQPASRPPPEPVSEQQLPVSLGELREPHPEPELVSARHKVAPGETMYRISRTYGITVEELSRANGIDDPRTLSVGQELFIPGVGKPIPVASEPAPEKPEKERPVSGTKPPASGTPTPVRSPPVVSTPSRPVPHGQHRPVPNRPRRECWIGL